MGEELGSGGGGWGDCGLRFEAGFDGLAEVFGGAAVGVEFQGGFGFVAGFWEVISGEIESGEDQVRIRVGLAG